MISEKTVFQIQNFKPQGRTQVWIARELQISQATVRGLSQFLWQDATKMGLSPSAGPLQGNEHPCLGRPRLPS